MANPLYADYPWTSPNHPLIVSAPMMKITLAPLAVAVSHSGGFGFLAAGFDLTPLEKDLQQAHELCERSGLFSSLMQSHSVPSNKVDATLDPKTSIQNHKILPIGVGFQNWGAPLDTAVGILTKHPVSAVWFFAPTQLSDLIPWAQRIRDASNHRTKIWVQVGTVAEAIEVCRTGVADVLVAQGADAGGHGLKQRAGIVTLLPEIQDALRRELGIDRVPVVAAGGIVDGRGAAAMLSLGADGVVLGTRFLACREATISRGYCDEILRATDGGTTTVKSTVYDVVRGIKGWPVAYDGRAVANSTYLDAVAGMSDEENAALYKDAVGMGDRGWGPEGRMTTYAGTGVGLVREIKTAEEIVREVQGEAVKRLNLVSARL